MTNTFDASSYAQMVQNNLAKLMAARGIDPVTLTENAANQAGQYTAGLTQAASQGLNSLAKVALLKKLSGAGSAAATTGATTSAGVPVGTALNGGTLMSTGEVVPASLAPETVAAAEPLLGVGVGPLAAIAGATYLGGKSAYDLIKGREDKSIPGYIGRASLGIATGGLSELARGLMGGKSKEQLARDKIRSRLQDYGIADSNYSINGVDIGGDGSKKTYNVDFSNSKAGSTVSKVNALASLLSGKGHLDKQTTDTAGFLTNALLQSKDANADARTFYNKAGFSDAASVHSAIDSLKNSGAIDQQVANVYKQGVSEVFKGGNSAKKK